MAIKLRTVDAWKHGQTNIIPYAGAVTFSEDGVIEVENMEIAEAVENAGIGIYIVGGDKEKALNTPAEPETTKEEVKVIPPGEPLKTKSEEDELNPPDPNKIGEGDEGKNNIGTEGSSTVVDEKSELIKALNEKTG